MHAAKSSAISVSVEDSGRIARRRRGGRQHAPPPCRQPVEAHAARVLFWPPMPRSPPCGGYHGGHRPPGGAGEAPVAPDEIDLVVLDIGLPGMDGFTWLKRLRAR